MEQSEFTGKSRNKIVQVHYPDGTERKTTVGELWVFFEEERPEWREFFFETLLLRGQAASRFANYIIEELTAPLKFKVMQNIKMNKTGTKLTIEIDLSVKGEPSGSGKSVVIASTRGNKVIPDTDDPIFIGVNCYKKR